MALSREQLLDLMYEIVNNFNADNDRANGVPEAQIQEAVKNAKPGIMQANQLVLDMLFQTGAISQATLAFATTDNIQTHPTSSMSPPLPSMPVDPAFQAPPGAQSNQQPLNARVEDGNPVIPQVELPPEVRMPSLPPIHVPGTRPKEDELNQYAPPPPPQHEDRYAHLPQTAEEAQQIVAEQYKRAVQQEQAKNPPNNIGQFHPDEMNGVDLVPTIPPRGRVGMKGSSPLPETPGKPPNHLGEIPLPKADKPESPQPIRDPWQQPNPLLMPNNNQG